MPDTGLFQSVACSELKNSLSLTHFSEQRMALVFVSLLSSHALIPEGYSPRRDLRQALKSTASWQAQLSSFAKLHPNAVPTYHHATILFSACFLIRSSKHGNAVVWDSGCYARCKLFLAA